MSVRAVKRPSSYNHTTSFSETLLSSSSRAQVCFLVSVCCARTPTQLVQSHNFILRDLTVFLHLVLRLTIFYLGQRLVQSSSLNLKLYLYLYIAFRPIPSRWYLLAWRVRPGRRPGSGFRQQPVPSRFIHLALVGYLGYQGNGSWNYTSPSIVLSRKVDCDVGWRAANLR